MNYLAEPYVAIVDQLLTGLTGGEARETHTFFPATLDYSLTHAFMEVKVNTIRVTGQAGKKFTLFVPGRDWKFTTEGKVAFLADPADDKKPAENAVWPDEGTEFYVSYYHDKSDRALLTDRNVGSLNRTLAEAFSRELAVLEKQLERVYQSGFIDSARGNALDQVVALLGVKRKGGDFATGTVRFYRATAAPGDIYLPANTRISTALNPPVSFVTTSARTLRKGQLSVEADIRAEQPGTDGVVAAGVITVINETIHGIDSVTNDAATLFSGEKESDAELRVRAKRLLQQAGRATKGAILNAITSEAGLKKNELKLVEDFQAHPGVVKLFVAREPSVSLASAVDKALLDSRPAGIRFEHNLQNVVKETSGELVSDEVLRDESVTASETSSATTGDDFRLPIKCHIKVYPENARLTSDEENSIRNAIVDVVYDYVDQAAIGQTLVFNQIVVAVMAVAGVNDMVMDLFQADDASGKGRRNLVVPDGQRAVFENKLSDIQVIFVGAPVYFDFNFAIVLKAPATLSQAELEIKQKLVSYFETAPGSIAGSALHAVLQPSDLFSLDPADQHWTVEYEQAGLTIQTMDETVSLAETEQAVLRKITVEEKT